MLFLQLDERHIIQRNEHKEDGINLTVKEKPSWSKEAEQRNVHLEEKLAKDNELDITGILNLSSMNLTDNDLPLIIQRAFRGEKNKCIGLILRDNTLTSIGVKMLVDELLMARTNLKYLSFSNNSGIGDVGIEHLVRLLQRNRSITFLALPHTGITDRSVRLLTDTLCGLNPDSSCPPLEKLYISFNKLITDESVEALLQLLEQNQTLKVLSLEHCSLSEKAQRRLRQAVIKTKKKKFSLSE
jgi:Ran GTPase-activating protein (RanGAP) involved in mRNA processing and transport